MKKLDALDFGNCGWFYVLPLWIWRCPILMQLKDVHWN